MSRGSRAALVAGLALAAAACGGCVFLQVVAALLVSQLKDIPGPRATHGSGRTVVLCAVDDLRPQSLKPYGYRLDPAPEMSALAARGAAAAGYRAASAATSPSLASLLTGLPPEEHGLLSARELGAHRLAPAVETLAEALRSAGWRTLGAISLRQLGRRLTGLDQGFGVWLEDVPWSGKPLPAAEVVEAALRELREVGEDDDLFLLLHFGDLREEGGAAWLEPHLGPFRSSDPVLDAALERAAHDPAGALEELELLLARRRGDPALLALRAARYDARLAEVDSALQGLVERLRAARGDPLVIVAGTRGRALRGEAPEEGAESAEALRDTALFAAGPGVGPGWSALAGPEDLARRLRETLGLPAAARAAPSAAGAAPGWELDLALPPGADAELRLESPAGELAGLEGQGHDVRRSPAGSSAEVAVRGAARLTVRCARRTAPLVLLAPGLRSAARVDEEGGAVQVPVFPATAEGAGERARPRVLVERDGPWAVVRAAADPEEQVELSLWAYPPEPFGASLEHAVEPAGADVRAYPGLDAVLVRAFGSTLARVRLRAGQRLAVAASIGGAAVAPAEMLSDEGGPTGVLALYLPPSDAAALPLALPAAADVRARRVYAGPPMEALYDLDDDDVRFLRRLGPLE